MITIRKGIIEDLDFLIKLEKESFPIHRQNSKRSLRLSLKSPYQEVYIADYDNKNAGAAIIQIHRKTIRIYSIAVLPEFKGKKIGIEMIDFIKKSAKNLHCEIISLEADANNEKLIEWYESLGFEVKSTIEDYYEVGESAFKMTQSILDIHEKNIKKGKIKNIIIIDQPIEWLDNIENTEVVDARKYIADVFYQKINNARVFNLCSSYEYQSLGYYVSLLASARNHRVIPNVSTMSDFSSHAIMTSIFEEEEEFVQSSLKHLTSEVFTLNIYFGNTTMRGFNKFAKEMYLLFEAPLLKMVFEKKDSKWLLSKAQPISINDIADSDIEKIKEFAYEYFDQKRFNKGQFKNFQYDLAILIDPDEKMPPSCPIALEKFKKTAEKIGFYTEFITKKEFNRIPEFDALFIRTTTNVNDYTYNFSRYAYAEGLVVIDDPWSISRCSNKLYLQERMKKGKILMPKSWILTKDSNLELHQFEFVFPLVVKQPDSAFSKGVFKVDNLIELKIKLNELFETSELVVAQEFIQSDFDWRIGLIDNTPIFACRYYMAKGHWQIYNWNKTDCDDSWGKTETLPLNQVPQQVLNTAIKAAALIGDGLYGVDIKEVDDKVYLIEVNDNPNIDEGVEDLVMGDQLYQRIMQSFYNRIENERNTKRLINP